MVFHVLYEAGRSGHLSLLASHHVLEAIIALLVTRRELVTPSVPAIVEVYLVPVSIVLIETSVE